MGKLRIALILIIGLILYTVVITGLTRYVTLNSPNTTKKKIGEPLSYLISETSGVLYLLEEYFSEPQFLIPNDSLKDGATYYGNKKNWPKLLISYQKENKNIVELVDLEKDNVINTWTIDNTHLKSNDKFIYYELRHPFLTKDSSIIGVTNGNLVKFNSRDELLWKNNKFHFHHTIEPDIEGNLYACGRMWIPNNYKFQKNKEEFESSLVDDLIVKVDPDDGKILYHKSIIDIFIENGYERLLYDSGFLVSDILHLNDIQPALKSSPYWEVGDLLVSLRSLSIVFLYRPDTNKILWLKKGPWLSQHDADFLANNKIGVFGNDVLFDFSGGGELGLIASGSNLVNEHNNFYVYDFESDEITTPFTDLFERNKIGTLTSGRTEMLDSVNLFVEETNFGRIIIGDSVDKKFQFVRRIDENHLSILNWSRLIK